MSIQQHLDNDKGWLFFCASVLVPVDLKDVVVVLDELNHDTVTDVLVLHCFQTRSHTEKEGEETKNKTKKERQWDFIRAAKENCVDNLVINDIRGFSSL